MSTDSEHDEESPDEFDKRMRAALDLEPASDRPVKPLLVSGDPAADLREIPVATDPATIQRLFPR